MGILQIALFGDVRMTHDDWTTEVQLTPENQTLLAYLLLQRHKVHSREILADIFWGEHGPERARRSLNTALWKLKKKLEPEGIPPGTYLKNTHLSCVVFNKDSQYWLDVQVFEDEINRILICPFQAAETSHLVDLEKALTLYKGDLLEGIYMDWALRERERMRALYLKSLIYLLQYYSFHQAYEKAITYGQQILDLDPLREEIHREMMRLYLDNGQRLLAIRQYEICHKVLATELGISPMEGTQALYAQIFTVSHERASLVNFKEQMSLERAVHQLIAAGLAIDLVKEQIQEVLQLIAKYS